MNTIGSLFSGIGGLELGLERSGLGRTAWQVEIDPFCREVLARHWPNARRYEDVAAIDPSTLEPVDLLCGGFPCQDVSQAAHGANPGLAGERSGLWYQFLRIAGALRPGVVVVENVASGKARWLPTVRRGLYLLGYDSTAYAVSAAACGAPHSRKRIFVVAYPHGDGQPTRALDGEVAELSADAGAMWNGWNAEPGTLRMDDGLPAGMDRLRALGNAVVPQCAESVGRMIRSRAVAGGGT